MDYKLNTRKTRKRDIESLTYPKYILRMEFFFVISVANIAFMIFIVFNPVKPYESYKLGTCVATPLSITKYFDEKPWFQIKSKYKFIPDPDVMTDREINSVKDKYWYQTTTCMNKNSEPFSDFTKCANDKKKEWKCYVSTYNNIKEPVTEIPSTTEYYYTINIIIVLVYIAFVFLFSFYFVIVKN